MQRLLDRITRMGAGCILSLLLQHGAAAAQEPAAETDAAHAGTEPPPQGPGRDPRSRWFQPEPHPWWVAAEFHLSVLSNLAEKSTINLTFGYAGRAGYRWRKDWGAYIQVEQNLWIETEVNLTTRQGALNAGLGLEHLYFNERMRSAVATGPSVLLYNTALDKAGTTGVFIDVRPTGIRWPVGKRFILILDPLTFTLVMPVVPGIPLVQLQYRTVFGLEYGVGR